MKEKLEDRNIRKIEGDIIDLILADHVPLKKFIHVLKDAESKKAEKRFSYEKFAVLLMSHAKAEEKALYRRMQSYRELRVESFEGETEHEVAEHLMQEINTIIDDEAWSAKVKVLADSVERHIEEEENAVLPNVKKHFSEELRLKAGAEYLRLREEYDVLQISSEKSHKANPSEHRLH